MRRACGWAQTWISRCDLSLSLSLWISYVCMYGLMRMGFSSPKSQSQLYVICQFRPERSC